MGISANSHGKKSDKETQSPLLKIFKEIMVRETNDPEKRNLLEKEEKKKKQYIENKKSNESNGSVHRKRSPYKVLPNERNVSVLRGNQCAECPSEKRTSWWKLNPPKGPNEADDDTCSCVSCALKRIVSSEYASIFCLVLIFCITIVVACLLVFKNIPSCAIDSATHTTAYPMGDSLGTWEPTVSDSDRLKRKIEMINDNRVKNELSEEGVFGKPHYDDIRSDPMDMPGSSEIDFGPSLRELNSLEGSESSNIATGLSPLGPDKLDMYSSDKLKEFYTKLVQTDAKIKNLKKIIADGNFYPNGYDKTPDRTKRTLKLFKVPNPYPLIRRKRDISSSENSLKRIPRKSKRKRSGNMTGDSQGFVIEKKKLIVQYKPSGNIGRKLVAKCSHSPKDAISHQHEHHLKHPFYQNTQRLDELLDRFLDKNLPEIISDPFGLDFLFKQKKNKCKHPQPKVNVNIIENTQKEDVAKMKTETEEPKGYTKAPIKNLLDNSDIVSDVNLLNNFNSGRVQTQKPKAKAKSKLKSKGKCKDMHKKLSTTVIKPASDIMKMLRPESTTAYEGIFNAHKSEMINQQKLKLVTSSPNDFEVLLSVSTIMNPKAKKAVSTSTESLLRRIPNLRRLMQMEGEEEENLGYEDFKEVLTDEMENHDELDRRGERKRRHEGEEEYSTARATPTFSTLVQETPEKVVKYNPPGVQNPNWKGPMPLYPDELNSMIKHAAMIANRPFGTAAKEKALKSQLTNRQRRDLTDLDYVEGYLDNKYDKLVEMAQAYSDYGVLEGKKDNMRNEKNPATDNISVDNRVKLSAAGSVIRRDIVRRPKKGGISLNLFEDEEQYGPNAITLPSSETQSSEGLRLELLPTTLSRLEDQDLFKFLSSHLSVNTDEREDDMPSTQNSMQISMTTPYLIIAYPPEIKQNYIDVDRKNDETQTDGQMDSLNNIAFGKGRNLLSTIFKVFDEGNVNSIGGEYLGNDIDSTQHSINKRDAEPTNEIKLVTNAENYGIGINQLKNANNEKMSVKLASNKLSNYLMSQATKANVDIFKYPYLTGYNSGELPFSYTLAVYMPKSNGTVQSTQQATESLNSLLLMGKNAESKENSSTIEKLTQSLVQKQTQTTNIVSTSVKNFNITNETEQVQHNLIKLEQNANVTAKPENIINLEELERKLNVPNVSELANSKLAEAENDSLDLKEQNIEETFNSNKILVKTEPSEIKPKYVDKTQYVNCEKEILFKLDHPMLGVESINFNFDASLFLSTFSIRDNAAELASVEIADVDTNEQEKTTPAITVSFIASVTGGKRGKRNVSKKDNKQDQKNVENLNSIKPKRETASNTENKVAEHISNLVSNVSEINNVKLQNANVNDNITLSEFFMMISNWFKTLESMKVNTNKPKETPVSNIAELLLQFNNASSKPNKFSKDATSEPYPSYDSYMIENIGHRSRVLLSVKESNITEAEESSKSEDAKVTEAKAVNQTSSESNITTTTTSTTTLATSNKTTPEKDKHTTTIAPKKDSDTRKVKRNADDSNLIFWNDIYDDEYGTQNENRDSPMQEKVYTKNNDFIKRSGRWVHDKIKKITQNLKRHDQLLDKERIPRAAKRIAELPKYIGNKIYAKLKKRGANDPENDDVAQMNVFNTLSANMLEVCKKAALAVKETSKPVVEDPKDSTIATSLMQQLIRLLTDLVDYQIQAKTCAKLPPDLKSFLEWLTLSDEEINTTEKEPEAESSTTLKTTIPYLEDVVDELVKIPGGQITTTLSVEEMQIKPDVKTQYLETLRSVQDLLDQYEEMSDADKSKMTGVKYYLQNQLRYLNKQFTGYDMYNIFDKHDMPLLYKHTALNEYRNPNIRRKRKMYKFVKNFGKKHTRTTASYYDGISVTDKRKSKDVFDTKLAELDRQKKFKTDIEIKKAKRNLKDVYYKALADAKKFATSHDDGHKQADVAEFSTTQKH